MNTVRWPYPVVRSHRAKLEVGADLTKIRVDDAPVRMGQHALELVAAKELQIAALFVAPVLEALPALRGGAGWFADFAGGDASGVDVKNRPDQASARSWSISVIHACH